MSGLGIMMARHRFGCALGSVFLVLATAKTSANENTTVRVCTNAIPERSILDRSHEFICRNVTATADWFDSFLGDERMEEATCAPLLRVTPSVEIDKYGEMTPEMGLHLKMPLPKTERRFHLIMSSLIRNDEAGDSEFPSSMQDEEDSSVSVAARMTLVDKKSGFLNVDAGVRLAGMEAKPYVKFRTKKAPLGERAVARFTQKVFWVTDEGLGETSRLTLDYAPSQNLLFRATTTASCCEDELALEWRECLSLSRHSADKNSAVSLEACAYGYLGEDDVEECRVGFGYRRRFLRDWTSLEIEPIAEFKRESNYELVPILKIQLDIRFDSGASR